MVEPVALLLNGRGHNVVRAREAGLADEPDSVLVEYSLIDGLIIVSFDSDIRGHVRRTGARCLHVHPPEVTARERVSEWYDAIVRHFEEHARLVTLPRNGPPRRDDPRPR